MDVKSPATKPEDVAQTNEWKVDVIRFALVYGFTVKLESRLRHATTIGYLAEEDKHLIDFDLMRARGLLHAQEFEIVKSLMQKEQWKEYTVGSPCNPETRYDHLDVRTERCGLAVWALQQIRHRIAQFTVAKHGTVERVLSFLGGDMRQMQRNHTKILMFAAIPVPIDYMQMTKLLIIFFQIFFPIGIPSHDGVFVNLFFPAILVFIFYGIDIMCSDMEDPFGDDPSDIKIEAPLWEVEVETMQLLQDRCSDVKHRFSWYPVPTDDEWLRPRKVERFLVLESERSAVQEMEKELRNMPN